VVSSWALAGICNWPTVPTELLWTVTYILNLYSKPSSVFLPGIWVEIGSLLNQHRLTWLGESPHILSNEDQKLFLCA